MSSDREVPVQDYIPGAKANLIIRLDEFGATGTVPRTRGKLPQQRASAGKGGSGPPPLQVIKQSDGSFLVGLPGDDPSTSSPQRRDSSADGYTVRIPGIIPLSAQLGRNGIRTADTLNLEFNRVDLPLDPRCVRSCAVEFYLGTVTADEFALGVQGVTRGDLFPLSSSAQEPLHVVPDTYLDEQGNQRSNLRFQGFVDRWTVEMSEKLAVARVECTDNTRLMIQQEGPPGLAIAAGKPIDEAVAGYLANFQQMRGLEVEVRPAGADRPQLDAVLAKTAFRPNLGPPIPKGGGSPQKFNTWDYISTACAAVGHTCRVEGTRVVIQRARTLYGSQFIGSRGDDPFTGRVLPSGRILRTRLMVYGRNLSTFSVERKYATQTPENVEVRCYVAKRKTTLVARHPPKKAASSAVTPSAGGGSDETGRQEDQLPGEKGSEEKFKVITVSGIEDQATLNKIAQEIYETIGRNQIEVKATTAVLGSYGGSNLDTDLLDLQAGDSLQVEVSRDADGFSSLTAEEDAFGSEASTADVLRKLGYDDDFAAKYARAYADVGLPTTFRVKRAGFDWDKETGVKVDLGLCNFIEVRADQALADGEPVAPEVGTAPVPVRVDA